MCSFFKHMDNIMKTARNNFFIVSFKMENNGVAQHIFCQLAMNSKIFLNDDLHIYVSNL